MQRTHSIGTIFCRLVVSVAFGFFLSDPHAYHEQAQHPQPVRRVPLKSTGVRPAAQSLRSSSGHVRQPDASLATMHQSSYHTPLSMHTSATAVPNTSLSRAFNSSTGPLPLASGDGHIHFVQPSSVPQLTPPFAGPSTNPMSKTAPQTTSPERRAPYKQKPLASWTRVKADGSRLVQDVVRSPGGSQGAFSMPLDDPGVSSFLGLRQLTLP